MKIALIDGPNMDLLERRGAIYGNITLAELENMLKDYAREKGVTVDCFQSNCEGEIIDLIHRCFDYDGLIINPAAYSHYSYAIADALEMLCIPKAEVHLTDINSREEFRRNLVTGSRCDFVFSGMGPEGYLRAFDAILNKINCYGDKDNDV